MTATTSRSEGPLLGRVTVPGDKSVSHRAIMFASLAVGESRISGLLEGEDVMATANAMRAMGADISRGEDGHWSVHGVGVGGLQEPETVLDMGNSGTSTRLLLGLLASHDLTACFTGDASLRGRPMQRVIAPIEAIGAEVMARRGGRLPLTVRGTNNPVPIDYRSPVASAQVKSAVLLAGLNTPGETLLTEPVATRDHSERMLSAMGADLQVDDHSDGGRTVRLCGPAELNPISISVPGDISSAAFLMVATSIVPGSELVIEGVGTNPLRTGIIPALQSMGADLTLENTRDVSGEPVADVRVRAAALKAVDGVPEHPSTMIDEFPVLFVAAATAKGTSRFTGLKELRVKESDRISAMAAALEANGVTVRELEDGIEIEGCDGPVPGGGRVTTHLDHRIAMASLVMGLGSQAGVTIDDIRPTYTSFPGFSDLMTGLGAVIGEAQS